jgi:hypothetical protein
MSELIEEFKKDHAQIMAMLNEVKELGILSKEGQAKLISTKTHLLAHLKKEDEKLYPPLRKEAEYNERLGNTLDLFTLDMETVSSVVQEFFDKYSGGEIDGNFSENFERLSVALSTRIRNEEDALYEEYEEINR